MKKIIKIDPYSQHQINSKEHINELTSKLKTHMLALKETTEKIKTSHRLGEHSCKFCIWQEI